MKLLLALLALAASPYREAAPGYHFRFPRDHFAHPDFKTEWWYYTGNLQAGGGHRFGFELVFFRQAQRRGPSDNRSAWRIDDLYLAHLALTDIDGRRFASHRRLNRAGPGLAGAAPPRVWNGNWSATWGDEGVQILEARGGGSALPPAPESAERPCHTRGGWGQPEGRGAGPRVVFTCRSRGCRLRAA